MDLPVPLLHVTFPLSLHFWGQYVGQQSCHGEEPMHRKVVRMPCSAISHFVSLVAVGLRSISHSWPLQVSKYLRNYDVKNVTNSALIFPCNYAHLRAVRSDTWLIKICPNEARNKEKNSYGPDVTAPLLWFHTIIASFPSVNEGIVYSLFLLKLKFLFRHLTTTFSYHLH